MVWYRAMIASSLDEEVGSFSPSSIPIWPVVYETVMMEPYLDRLNPHSSIVFLQLAIPSIFDGTLKDSPLIDRRKTDTGLEKFK